MLQRWHFNETNLGIINYSPICVNKTSGELTFGRGESPFSGETTLKLGRNNVSWDETTVSRGEMTLSWGETTCGEMDLGRNNLFPSVRESSIDEPSDLDDSIVESNLCESSIWKCIV